MKKNLYLAIILSLSTLFNLLGQTTKKSLNYQAVILDPKSIDIPGASLSGQPLSKGKVCLKFTFVNAQGTVDYEEIQQTTTDEYGLVSISVGTGTYNAGTYKNFENIVWDANVKSMKVAVSYDGCNSFKQVSTQALNYTPYALYAEAVDYKNVKDAPTKLSQFSNDAGYLIPKDLDPIKADIKKNTDDIKTNTADIKTNSADIKTNAGQIASTIQTIAENKKASDDSFLIVKQSISDLGTKVVSNTNSIVTIEGKINEQQNLISDTRNQLNTATNTINGQINGLQNQVTTTANTVNSFSNEYQTVANKSTAINLGGGSPSDQLYPSQKAAKSYVDNAIYNAVGTGVADDTTLAPGKVRLAGDLAGTANSPTVPALANKENTSNKSTNVNTDANSDTKYPSVKAIKTYVDQATQGIALQAAVDAKADKNSPIFTGTPSLPTGTIAVTQNGADNSTKLATTAFVQAATAAGIIDASSTTKGKLKLAGDLGGTAESPTVPGLALKANSADVTSSLALKENTSNKSTATALGTSDALYPSQKAVKTYVDAQIASATIADADPSTKGKIQLAGDLGGTAALPTVPGLALKANTADVNTALGLKAKTTDMNSALALKANSADMTTALGLKANSADVTSSLALKEDTSNKSTATALGTSDALYPSQKAVKTYVDAQIASGAPDADASTKGKIQLTGDLGGIAASPTVPGLALKANSADVTTSLSTKVDKVTGKELSTNDYTTAEKTKLASAVPYMGATQAVDLGAFDLNVNGITVGKGGGNQSGNTVIGDNALVNNTEGIQNTANGNWALFSNTTGIKNTASGVSALESNTTGSNNTAIGSDANVGSGNLTNTTAIGYQAVVNTSNTIQLGNTSITDVKTSGTLTAGTVTYPNAHNNTSGQVLITDGNGFASFGSIPVLNQTTTGSAATLTTPRTIHGGSFDGSANVTNIIASTYGGTGNGFTKFTGPSSSEKTFTLPDADATILTSNTIVTVAQGGTGTNNGSITGTSALTFAAGGTNQNVSILASGTGSVGIGTNSPSSSAALDISSTAKGFLPPRLTTTQRDAITTPAEGLTVWNTTNKQLEVYDGTYWVTMNGKLVSPINVGDSYGGGKVAYIFTSTDLGYVAGQTHGLIAAVADQTTDAGIPWFPDKFYGATVTALGLGLPNTISIIAAAVVLGKTDLSTYAAGLANNYKGGGYNDWFLPSRDELNKLFINRAAIGGFATTGTMATYWSSSQKGSMNFSTFTTFTNGISSAYQQFFFAYNGNSEGTQTDLGISNLRRVRAVRIF